MPNKNAILTLLKAGLTQSQIARMHGVSRQAIHNRINKQQKTRDGITDKTRNNIAAIMFWTRKGLYTTEIAKEMNLSYHTIWKITRKFRITKNSR